MMGKVGRPTSAPRTERLSIRCTPEEKTKLLELAAKAGVSLTAFVIGCAAGDKLGAEIEKKLKGD